MTNSNELIEWFRASTTYINAHRGKVFVVAISGEALADENFPNLVHDLSLLQSLGIKLVLCHGARPQISAALEAQGSSSQYHQNLRITNSDNMQLVKQVVGALSIELEAHLSMGLRDSPMYGAELKLCRGNFVTAKPAGIHDGVDFHYTGKVRKIDVDTIVQQLANDSIVLLSNLGYSLTGEVFNLSAEEVATEAAIALNADKLIMLIPDDGVINEAGELVPSLTEEDANAHAARLNKLADANSLCVSHALQAALHAYKNQVHRSHLISFKSNGAMLQELFTRQGNGSLISNDNFDLLRNANIEDVAGILALIKPLEENGSLVTRSRELLENEIGNFKLIELEGIIVACAALYEVSNGYGEISCIAIEPNYQKNGFGDQLLACLENTAREKGLHSVFVLTTVASHWFIEKGFLESNLDELPQQRQQLYNFQRNSSILLKKL